MADDPVSAIEKILTGVDATLRRRLAKTGHGDTDHIVLALAPDGDAVIRSNCGPEALRAMAAMLVEIADQVQASGQGKPN